MVTSRLSYLSIALLFIGSPYAHAAKKGVVKVKTAEEFNKIINEMTPTVITFISPTCGACVAMDQTFTDAANNYGNSVTFAKVDVTNDKLKPIVDTFGINATPTIFYKELGTKDKNKFNARLQALYGKPEKQAVAIKSKAGKAKSKKSKK